MDHTQHTYEYNTISKVLRIQEADKSPKPAMHEEKLCCIRLPGPGVESSNRAPLVHQQPVLRSDQNPSALHMK
jgi:hypothetical protein